MLTLKARYSIVYFNDRVFKQVKQLPKKLLARYVVLSERMEHLGPSLGLPHTRSMGNNLFELRIKAEEGIARVFYCLKLKNEIMVLHSFIKKTQEIPKKELALARKRLKEGLKND